VQSVAFYYVEVGGFFHHFFGEYFFRPWNFNNRFFVGVCIGKLTAGY